MTLQDRHELVVIDVGQAAAQMAFAEKSKVGKQLAKPNIRRKIPNFLQQL
jgi:hypothetical protein